MAPPLRKPKVAFGFFVVAQIAENWAKFHDPTADNEALKYEYVSAWNNLAAFRRAKDKIVTEDKMRYIIYKEY